MPGLAPLAVLWLAQAAAPASRAAPDPAALARIEDPRARARAVAALAAGEATALAARLERGELHLPLEPLALAPGRVHRLELDLWHGPEHGVVRTEVFVFVPARFEAPAPLLLAAHGTGTSAAAEVEQWRAVAGRAGAFVAAWSDPRGGRGFRASEDERRTTLSLRRWALRRLPVDPDRIFLAGTSRGGHLTWDLACRTPDLWAGIAPLIGAPRLALGKGANSLRYVENLRFVPIRDLQGLNDDPNLIFNLKLAFEKLEGAPDAKLVTFADLGHDFRFGAVDWVGFLTAKRRPVLPEQIVLAAADPAYARSAWLRIARFGPKVARDFRPTIAEKEWKRLSADARKRWYERRVEERTARAAVRLAARAPEPLVEIRELRGVRRLELLVPRRLAAAGRWRLRVGKRLRRLRPRRDARRTLRAFFERLDPERCPLRFVSLRL